MRQESLTEKVKHGLGRVVPRGLKDQCKQAYYTNQNRRVMKKTAGDPLPALTPGVRMYAYMGGAFGVGMLGGMVASGCRSAEIPLSIGAVRVGDLHRFAATPWDDLVEPLKIARADLNVFF